MAQYVLEMIYKKVQYNDSQLTRPGSHCTILTLEIILLSYSYWFMEAFKLLFLNDVYALNHEEKSIFFV